MINPIIYINLRFFSLLTLLVFFLFSCTNETEETITIGDDISGNWELTGLEYQCRTVVRETNGRTYTALSEGFGENLSTQLLLSEDGSYITTGCFTIKIIVWSGTENIEETIAINDFLAEGSYTFNEDQLLLRTAQNNVLYRIEIITLTDTTLAFTVEFSSDNFYSGANVSLKGTYLFTKN